VGPGKYNIDSYNEWSKKSFNINYVWNYIWIYYLYIFIYFNFFLKNHFYNI
jgi:hypothetical protein